MHLCRVRSAYRLTLHQAICGTCMVCELLISLKATKKIEEIIILNAQNMPYQTVLNIFVGSSPFCSKAFIFAVV